MINRFITIHGHFYQPPRENPWLEAIEMQDSAAPYHDWNERVAAESYATNAASRILDEKHRIVRIVNNYSRISFDFGPTLMSWLEKNLPDTYEAVIEADRESAIRFGRGSAMAQAYNHMIMPLATRRDKETQVRWGIRDFEVRFGRKPEGMWLPEAAVDLETLEIMAAEGITFTVLAPHQASKSRAVGETAWADVSGGRIDPSTPYDLELPSGRHLSIFFYDGPISRAVAFENLLGRGEYLADRLVGAFSATRKWSQLVHIATDGETYGHHHRFGEMALAYALDYIESKELARLTNYASFLALFPPTHQVEIHENTSWSCMHGVERWRSDCGCETGAQSGWNQGWREPLREALDWLRDIVDSLFEDVAAGIFVDPWGARDGYIDVILDRSPEVIDQFLAMHAKRRLSPAEQTTALELLELQRHAMLMYTSCGWFFSDISGIETVQILRYAARVNQLAQKLFGSDLETGFLKLLMQADSNLPEQGNGRSIYERYVKPSIVDLQRVVAHHAVSSLFESHSIEPSLYCYDITRDAFDSVEGGGTKVTTGLVTVTSQITREREIFSFGVLYLGDAKFTGGARRVSSPEEYATFAEAVRHPASSGDFAGVVRIFDRHLNELNFSINSLFRREQNEVLKLIWKATLSEAEAAFRSLHDRYVPLIRFHADLDVPLPRALAYAAEADLNLRIHRALEREEIPIQTVEELLRYARREHVHLDVHSLGHLLSKALERTASQFREQPTLEHLQRLEAVARFAQSAQLPVDLWRAQNEFHRVRAVTMAEVKMLAQVGDAESREWLARFASTAAALSFVLATDTADETAEELIDGHHLT